MPGLGGQGESGLSRPRTQSPEGSAQRGPSSWTARRQTRAFPLPPACAAPGQGVPRKRSPQTHGGAAPCQTSSTVQGVGRGSSTPTSRSQTPAPVGRTLPGSWWGSR